MKERHELEVKVYMDDKELSALTATASGSPTVTSADTSSPIYIGGLPEG